MVETGSIGRVVNEIIVGSFGLFFVAWFVEKSIVFAFFVAISFPFVSILAVSFREEKEIEITEEFIRLVYFFRRERVLYFDEISKAFYQGFFVEMRHYNWKLCYQYNNCYNLGSRGLFSKCQQKRISKEILSKLENRNLPIKAANQKLESLRYD